jgi:hypothetical protein
MQNISNDVLAKHEKVVQKHAEPCKVQNKATMRRRQCKTF